MRQILRKDGEGGIIDAKDFLNSQAANTHVVEDCVEESL
jgi:hypothetical protein